MKHSGPAGAAGVLLAVLLCYGILTLWVPERWALSAYQAGALGLAAAWIARAAFRAAPLETSPLLLPLAGILCWGALQMAAGRTVYPWQTGNALLEWATHAALFFLALQVAAEPRLRRRLLDTLLWFGFLVCALAAVQVFTSGGKVYWLFPSGYDDLVLGPFVYRNQFAAFVEMVLPLALYRALADRAPLRYWIMAGAMAASVVAAASRAGAVLVCAEVFAVVALAVARGAVRARAAVLGLAQFAALGAVFTAVVGWEFLWQRFQQPDPYAVRREMLLASAQMFRERPWTGFGLGTWSTAYPAYALIDNGAFANQAHNDWAQWAVEGGLPLLALMLAFAALLVRPALRSVWGIGLLSVLVHAAVDYPMQQRPALAGWFFALAGALAASAQGAGGAPSAYRFTRASSSPTPRM